MARKKQADKLLAPDAFQEKGAPWVVWLEKNMRLVAIAIGAVVAVAIGVEVVGSSGTREASRLTSQLGEALEGYQEVSSPQFAATATSSAMLTRAYADARADLRSFREAHPGTGPARLALLYEADLAAKQGEHAAAAKLYDGYTDGSDPDDPLRFMALEGAGYAHETAGELDAALAAFERLAEIEYARNYALKHQSRVLEAKGDPEGAKAKLQELLDAEPSVFLKNFAENRLKLLD
jgi:tetratricopeptide (TPR) repeat protein